MKKTGLFLLALCFLLVGCSDHVTPDFTFAPAMPKCGQAVTFSNLTTGDEDWEVKKWEWDFGDNGTSLAKSPSHIYRKAGVYTVSLKVDSSKHLIKKMNITVYDSIPTILASVDSIKFYQDVTFRALIYNPTGATITYDWSFSDNAVSTSISAGKSSASTVTAFFKKFNLNEEVKLKVTVGDSVYDKISFKFRVHDYKAKSVLMAQKNGKILRQRIFTNGVEEYIELPVLAGKHPFNIVPVADKLYVFDAGSSVEYKANWQSDTSGDGSLKVVNLKDFVTTEIANNRNSSSHFGFYNGFADNQNLYWTDYSEFIYSSPVATTIGNFEWKGNADAQTSVPYYKTKADRVGYFGKGLSTNQFSGGIRYYDDAYYWAKGGATGRGIYRFVQSDILAANATSNTIAPALGAILTDFAIRAFVFDEIHAKIYFSVTAPADKVGLWVSNMNGSNPKRIEDAPMDNASLYITGIAVDSESNRLYWAYRSPESVGASAPGGVSWSAYYQANPTHKSGVKTIPLITNDLNIISGTISYFLPDVEVYGIAVDKIRR